MKKVIITALLAICCLGGTIISFMINDMSNLYNWYQDNKQQIELLQEKKHDKNDTHHKQDKDDTHQKGDKHDKDDRHKKDVTEHNYEVQKKDVTQQNKDSQNKEVPPTTTDTIKSDQKDVTQ